MNEENEHKYTSLFFPFSSTASIIPQLSPPTTSQPPASNSAHSDSLLRGHIGKLLALIMLYDHPLSTFCLLITFHPLCACAHILVCVWMYACIYAAATAARRTVMNHFHCNAIEAPPSPILLASQLQWRHLLWQPIQAAEVLCIHVPCQPNGIKSRAIQIKWDWTELGMDSLFLFIYLFLYEVLIDVKTFRGNLIVSIWSL